MVRVDNLLGKHFAIVGTTGNGKSCTTALVLRAMLQRHPAAHIVLLDPHDAYAPGFGDQAEVISTQYAAALLPLHLRGAGRDFCSAIHRSARPRSSCYRT